jgi:hypothetical protein
MDFEDVGTGFEGGFGEEDFSVYAAWAEEGWIEGVKTICGHDDLSKSAAV